MTIGLSGMRLAACGLALVVAGLAPARAAEVLRVKAVIEGQDGPVFAGNHRPLPVTLHLKPGASRVDFNQRGAEGIYMLIDEQTRQGWLVDGDGESAVPLQARGFAELWVDPEAPCEQFGVRCRPVPSRMIAGVRAEGWRYLDAGRRGPGGTARGEFWVDRAHGLIVGYEGYRAGRSRAYKMRAMSITPVEDAAKLFELPEPAGGERARR